MQTIQEAEDLKKPTRDTVRAVRWTAEQWREIDAAAKIAGMTPSGFIRGCTLSQAREINAKRRKG